MGLFFFPLAPARFVDSSTEEDEVPLRRWRREGPLKEEWEVFLTMVRDGSCDGSEGRRGVMMWVDGNDTQGDGGVM